MIAPNENGRPTETAGTPDGQDSVQAVSRTVPQYRHVLPMGATPWPTPDALTDAEVVTLLSFLRDAEGEECPDEYRCRKCWALGTNEARCLSCGEHRGDA